MLKATLDRLKGFTTEPRGKVYLKVRVLCTIDNPCFFHPTKVEMKIFVSDPSLI